MLGEDRGDHLFGRGLAVAARHRHDERLHAAQRVRREGVEGSPAVGDDDLDDSRRGLGLALDDHRSRSAGDRVAYEFVAVRLRAAKGEEEAASLHFARVGVKRGEHLADLGAADLTAPGDLEDLEEADSHTYMRTVRTGLVLCASPRPSSARSSARLVPRSDSRRSEEHTSESSHANISYAVFC